MQNDEKCQFLDEIRNTLCLSSYVAAGEAQEEVAECFDDYMRSEMDAEQDRALNRLAFRFKHLLKPRMQKILEARYLPDGTERPGSHEKRRLILDDIYEAENPEVERSLRTLLQQTPVIARERALVRLAWRFKHLLPSRMQDILEANYPP